MAQLNGFDGVSGPVLRFTAHDDDIAPLTPTDNPRAQLVGPSTIRPGAVLWESWLLRLPRSFPAIAPLQWIALWTPAYGPPFAESPPVELHVDRSRLAVGLNAHAPVPDATVWSMPLPRERWLRFTVQFRFAVNGWIELFVNDRPQWLREGTGPPVRRLALRTIDPSNDGSANSARIMVYYQRGVAPQLTAYFAHFRIGLTRAQAEPAS